MIIRINRNARIVIDKITGKVTWHYRAKNHSGKPLCHFDLLSEVGEWYVAQFKDYLESKGLGVNTVDNPDSGYYQTLYYKKF